MDCNDYCRHSTCLDRLYHLEYRPCCMDYSVSVRMEIQLIPCFFEHCECRGNGLAVICMCLMFVCQMEILIVQIRNHDLHLLLVQP